MTTNDSGDNQEPVILPKQKRFVDLYFKYDLDNIKAYMEAYVTDNYDAARRNSFRLLNETESVKPYLRYKQEQFSKDMAIDKGWVLRRLKKYTNAYDELVELSEQTNLTEGDKAKIKYIKSILKASDVTAFINMINKMGGFYEPDKVEVKQEWNISFGNE